MNHNFESALDAISVAYDKDDYLLCIKLCSNVLVEQIALTEAAKRSLLLFIMNSSRKLLDRPTSEQAEKPIRHAPSATSGHPPCASAPDPPPLSAMNA